MKHTIVIPVLMICLLLPFSCKKREQIEATTVNGQVRTFGSEDPIIHPPVKVLLLEQIPSAGWGSSVSYEVVDETMTDQSQNFTLYGDLSSNKVYYLGVDGQTISTAHHYQKLQYLDYTQTRTDWQLKSIGGTIHKNFYMVARGWVKFHFLSENPQPGDRYSYSVGGGGYEQFYDSINVFRIWGFAGNREHRIVYTLTRNGEYYPKQKHIFIPAFDTIDVQIKY